MLKRIKEYFYRYTKFNERNRYDWVSRQAKKIKAGSKVLDAGAGGCQYRGLFGHCDYKTQDFCASPKMRYDKIDYVSDILKIPVASGSFDVLLCAEVLEHVDEPAKAITEFSRIIKKGGKLLLTAPLGCGIHLEPHIYYGGFTPFWFKKFLSENGFTDINISPNGGFFEHYAQESVRFWSFVFPKTRKMWQKIIFFPLEALSALYFCMFIPIVCHALKDLDKEKYFTVGYFVEAVKKA